MEATNRAAIPGAVLCIIDIALQDVNASIVPDKRKPSLAFGELHVPTAEAHSVSDISSLVSSE